MFDLSIREILLILVILFLLYKVFQLDYTKCNKIEKMTEGFEVNAEALQNLSAMYDNGTLKVTNLEVTGKLSGAKLDPNKPPNNLIIDGSIQVGEDPTKAAIMGSSGTYWKDGNNYTWTGVGGFSSYRKTSDGKTYHNVILPQLAKFDTSVTFNDDAVFKKKIYSDNRLVINRGPEINYSDYKASYNNNQGEDTLIFNMRRGKRFLIRGYRDDTAWS